MDERGRDLLRTTTTTSLLEGLFDPDDEVVWPEWLRAGLADAEEQATRDLRSAGGRRKPDEGAAATRC